MNLKEIVFRESEVYDEPEVIYLVEQYIKTRKNRAVNIVLNKMIGIQYSLEMQMLMNAFTTAQIWYRNNWIDA